MAVADPQQTHYLKTGEEYVKSLQDGREVYYKGERVEDVTTHLATGRRHPRDRRRLRRAVRRARRRTS